MEKTKVIIQVEGLGEQTIFLTPEDAKAIYISASQEVINRLNRGEARRNPFEEMSLAQRLNAVCSSPKKEEPHKNYEDDPAPREVITKTGIAMLNKAAEEVLTKDKPMIVDGDEVKAVDLVSHKEAACIVRPFTQEIFYVPKLVMAKCPHCGVITAQKTILGDTDKLTCHFCKQDIEIEKVILTEASCPNCQSYVYFYAGNGLEEITCRQCQSPVDIVYIKGGKKAMSANLIKHGKINHYYVK